MRYLHNRWYVATPQSSYLKIIYLAEINLFFHVSVLFTNHYLQMSANFLSVVNGEYWDIMPSWCVAKTINILHQYLL